MSAAPIIGLAPHRETAADRRAMPDITDIAEAAAEKEGVCARVVPMRAFDPHTARTSYVGALCKSTHADTCPACAGANRYLRMTQLREGWCAEAEPVDPETVVTEAQQEVLSARALLFTDYYDARGTGAPELAEAIRDLVADLDTELRELGVRGRLPALDEKPRRKAKSTRRRDDVPDLPRKKINKAVTVGTAYANGKYRPSTFFTLTQNLRRAVGWNVQYWASVEPQKRGAPHLHIAIRGSIPTKLLIRSLRRPTSTSGGRITTDPSTPTRTCPSGITPPPRS